MTGSARGRCALAVALVVGVLTAAPISAADGVPAAPGVRVTPPSGPPGVSRPAYTSGFAPHETLDVYFDTVDVALASTDADGAAKAVIVTPIAATPGRHWITVSGRRSRTSAQSAFTVRTDWSQFGFTAQHVGTNPYEHTLSRSNVAGLVESWRSPVYGDVRASPAVVGGVVYTSFTNSVVAAYNEATGTQRWMQPVPVATYSSPAVSGGVVYLGSDDGHLYAYDARTGRPRWQAATDGAVRSPPAVSGDLVYVSGGRRVYAFDAATGARRWQFRIGQQSFSSPAVAAGVVYVGSVNNKLYALDAATGALQWATRLDGIVDGTPVVANGHVLVGTLLGKFYALRTGTGFIDWTYDVGALIFSTAAVDDGVVYFGASNTRVYALDAAFGTLRWSAQPSHSDSPTQFAGAACVANGVLYLADGQKTYAMDTRTGTVLSTFNAGLYNGGPVVANGALTVADQYDGVLIHYALEGTPPASPRPAPASLRPSARMHVRR